MVPSPVPACPGSAPLWLKIAYDEIGQQEIAGSKIHNRKIIEYHATTKLKATSDEIAWCSAYVCWVLQQCHLPHTQSAAAKSWFDYGERLLRPIPGCIAVIRSKKTGAYHVGFYVGQTEGGVWILGGNQRDAVNILNFLKDSVISYNWPKGIPHDAIGIQLALAGLGPEDDQPV